VAARYLKDERFDVSVLLIGHISDIKHDPKINADRLKVPINEVPDLAAFEAQKGKIKGADLIIDALFGIGLKTELASPFTEIITYLNSLHKPILSVDVPSGLDATTGKVLGAAIFADKTITFAAAKTGFYKGVGQAHTGEVIVADIGIPV
jgi:NAD(P)H-hydrate epimerase